MREFLLLAIVASLAVIAILKPKIGVYSIVWFSLMRPDVWAWSTEDYPYASILELGTLIGCLKCLPQTPAVLRNPIFRLLLALQVPIAFSVVLALHPTLCYQPYRWYIGCVVSSILIALLIQTEADFRRLVVIAALSIGYLGARFGLYGLIHGGVRFGGGYGASLSDNNTLALALAMGVPLGWYAKDLIRNKAVRLSLLISVFLTIGAVVFTYSRGAAISLLVGFVMVILHSRHRIFLLIGLTALTLPSVYLVRDTYTDRMQTLNGAETAQKDKSVLERMETSRVAEMMWEDYPIIGVGFGSENQRMLWHRYAEITTEGGRVPVIHDTYLQMLVDSGTFALLAYIALLGGAIVMMELSARRLRRAGSPFQSCPLAISVSLIIFAVGSTFLSRITFDFTYFLLMMGASWLIVEPGHLAALREAREREEEDAAEAGEAELAGAEADSFRSLLRHSAAYSVPVILGKMCSFIMLPVYTRYLTPADYGVLELLDLTSFVLSSLLGARLGDALCYFYAAETTEEGRGRVATTALVSAVAMGIIGALAGILLSAPLGKLVFGTTAYTPYFHLVFLNFVLAMPQEVGLSYLRVRNQSTLFTICLSVRLAVAIFFNVWFLAAWSMGVAAMLWSTLAASAVMAVGVGAILFSTVRPSFDAALCRRMVAYAVPIGFGGVALLVIHYGDRFFLQRSASLADVGIYSLAYKMGMLISYIQMPFTTYWTSQMYHIVRGEDGETINARVCTYLVLALSSGAVAITVFSHPILTLMTTPAFRGAALFIPLITGAYVMRGLGEQFRNVFLMENRTGSDAQASTVGCLLCVAGYVLLIPRYKMWGAATATLIAFTGLAAFSYWKSQRIKKYHYEVKRLVKIGFSAIVACAVALVASPAGVGAQFLVGAGSLALYLVLLITSGFFTRDEISTVKEFQDYVWQRSVGAL